MKRDDLIDSMNEIEDDLLLKTAALRQKKRSTPWRRLLTAAACILLLSATCLTVEAATSGSISNLLAPLFGTAQTELVDHIGTPVGEHDSVNGYTMTADAIIGDRYNLAIVYTLTREDGQPIPAEVCFEDWETDVTRHAGGGGSLVPIPDDQRPDQVHFVESWSISKPLLGRYVTARFSNLRIYQGNGQYAPLAEGTWELSYTLRYQDTTVDVPVRALKVTDQAGKEYQINQIKLSPVGLHIDGLLLNPVWEEEHAVDMFAVTLRLLDGTSLNLELTKGLSYSQGDSTADFSCETIFPEPIPLDQIEALVICGTEVPI